MSTNKPKCKIFPKLFIGNAAKAFIAYLKKNNYDYPINVVTTRDELLSFIETFYNYKNYSLPVIVSDISFFNHSDQSLLLKFIDDTKLNLIMLASRDNVLDTIISRVREFRKYYVHNSGESFGFIEIGKAREMFTNEISGSIEDTSYEDMISLAYKYNPMLSYDDYLVNRYSSNDKKKILSIIENSNER